jgi:hypothetical protein
MSRHVRKKHTTRIMSARVPTPPTPAISVQELEARCAALPVSPPTRARLKKLLEQEETWLVLAATTALALECEREEQQTSSSLFAWGLEELRLLFLEEWAAHLVESGHILFEALLALITGSAVLIHLLPIVLLIALLAGCCGLGFCMRLHKRLH